MDGLDGYPQTHPSIGNPGKNRVRIATWDVVGKDLSVVISTAFIS